MPPARHRRWLATGLAHAFLADHEHPGARAPEALLARARVCLGCEGATPEWLVSMAQAVATRWARQGLIDTVDSLAQTLLQRPEWAPDGQAFDDDDEDEPSDGTTPRPCPPPPTGPNGWA